MVTVVLSTQELAQLIQQHCNAIFEHANKASAIAGETYDGSSKEEALDAVVRMHDHEWEIRKHAAEIKKIAAAVERWAADPDTD